MYEDWKAKVDAFFDLYFGGGTTAEDFEDWLWYDDYTSGLSPQQSFQEWLIENS